MIIAKMIKQRELNANFVVERIVNTLSEGGPHLHKHE